MLSSKDEMSAMFTRWKAGGEHQEEKDSSLTTFAINCMRFSPLSKDFCSSEGFQKLRRQPADSVRLQLDTSPRSSTFLLRRLRTIGNLKSARMFLLAERLPSKR